MSVFRRGGQKAELFLADESVDYEAIRQEKLQELFRLWNLPRVGSHLSAAVWRHQYKLAEVVVVRGKVLERMGFVHKGRTYLTIEEAVYLVDRGDTLLVVELDETHGRPLTLSEAFELMASCRVPMAAYQVYCHLKRAGYAVTRHPAVWTLPHAAALPSGMWPFPRASVADTAAPDTTTTAAAAAVQADSEPAAQQSKGSAACGTQEDANGDDNGPAAKRQCVENGVGVPVEANAAPGTNTAQANTDAHTGLCVHFDAFAPSSKPFARKNPPAPTFSVVLAPQVPSYRQLAAQQAARAEDAPPLKYGTVDQGDVAFMELAVLPLPDKSKEEPTGGNKGGRGGGRGRGRGRGR